MTMSPTEGTSNARYEWKRDFSQRGPKVASARAVGRYLADWASLSEMKCTQQRKVIASELALSPKAVSAAVSALESSGWLERKKTNTGNTYHLKTPAKEPQVTSEVTSGNNRSDLSSPSPQVTSPQVTSEVTSGDLGSDLRFPPNRETKKDPDRPHTKTRARDSEIDGVIKRVGEELGRNISDAEAKRISELGETQAAVDAFIDVAKRYDRATTYKLIGFAESRMKQDAERSPKKPRNALNRPDDDLGQEVLARMLANATTVERGES